ncbi:hypothetical protein GSS88_06135 [Corynebacterium sp. 3HC-13]|uniref:PucR family transcriptional regulator n=1 Tax=Corynebacterium poyangense TaxID=2684405 RepID=UPI001CCEF57F|nr:PucR family transcriptional regulator [Corynebacterium poyangense]MBZ8177375.1 hypothetical protein [Corynebacterium poyangense]
MDKSIALTRQAGQSDALELRWLLRQTRLQLRPIWEHSAKFRAVHTSELHMPGEFLPDASIVLTLGMAFEKNPEDFWDYAAHLAENSVVGVGFGTGMVFPEVPPHLIDACHHHGIALFEVPRSTAFLSITSLVSEEFARRARRQRDQAARTQAALDQAAVTHGLSGLMARLAEALDADLAVVDDDARIYAQVGERALNQARRYLSRGHGSSGLGPGNLIQQMMSTGKRFHILSICSARVLSESDRLLVKHAAGLADILLRRADDPESLGAQLRSHALALHLGRDQHSEVIAHILQEVVDAEGRVRPMVVHADQPATMRRAKRFLEAALRREERLSTTLTLDDTTFMALFRGARTPTEMATLMSSLQSRLRLCVGSALRLSELTAPTVDDLALLCRAQQLGQWCTQADSGQVWLRTPAVAEILDQRAHVTWDRLVQVDKEQGSHFCETIAAWARAGTNLRSAAEALGVHRHTMRNRMAKIAEICEIDLHDPLVIAELLLVVASRQTPRSIPSG